MTLRLPTPLLALLIGLAVAVLLGLGTWQLQRNDEKQTLVADLAGRASAAPTNLDDAARLASDAIDYRRVVAEGRWDLDRAMIVANRARLQVKGEEIVVPLLRREGEPALLVNRGWFPAEERDAVLAQLRERAEQGLETAIEGVARSFADRTARLTAAGTWTGLAPTIMAAELPYPVLDWMLVEGESVDALTFGDGTLPVAQSLRFRNTTPHLEYAATWFALAAILLAVTGYGAYQHRRGRRLAGTGGGDAPRAGEGSS